MYIQVFIIIMCIYMYIIVICNPQDAHMLPFIKKWKVGCGLLGEQGAESIHNMLE